MSSDVSSSYFRSFDRLFVCSGTISVRRFGNEEVKGIHNDLGRGVTAPIAVDDSLLELVPSDPPQLFFLVSLGAAFALF